MKAARIVILSVAVSASGIVAGSEEPPPPAAARVFLIDTTDSVVAKGDINMGQVVSRSLIDANTPNTPTPDDGKAANHRLNMVRFGVTTSVTPKQPRRNR